LEKSPTALGFWGGNSGMFLIKKLENLGINHDLSQIRAESRNNKTILQKYSKKHNKTNEPGASVLEPEQVD